MTPLYWLAIPLVLTTLAAVVATVVGVWPRGDADARQRRDMERLRRALDDPRDLPPSSGQPR